MTALAELLAACDALGICLLPTGEAGLTVDGPRDALTAELLDQLKAHKEELAEKLRPDWEA